MLVELALQFPPREKVIIALSVILLTSIAIDQIILWTDEYEVPEQQDMRKSMKQQVNENSRHGAESSNTTTRTLSDDELYNLSHADMSCDHDQHVFPIGHHSEIAFSTGLVF